MVMAVVTSHILSPYSELDKLLPSDAPAPKLASLHTTEIAAGSKKQLCKFWAQQGRCLAIR